MRRSFKGKVKTGIIGIGDVSIERCLPQLRIHDSFELVSVADVVPEDEKISHITNGYAKYYQIDGKIPESFFDGLDVVYIASPNKFHLPQTLTSVYNGAFTVTEKPLVR